MPTFYPEHDNPRGHNLDAFTRGYLGAAEWLARNWQDGRDDPDLTRDERSRCRGFTRKAIAEAKRDCKAFQKHNRADLVILGRGRNLPTNLLGRCTSARFVHA